MQKIYLTENGIVKECDSIVKNCWVALTDPTNAEITQIAQQFHIDISDVRASLDEEERSRIETEDDYTLIVVDIPIIEERNGKDWYETIPLGIIMTEDVIFTICLEETPVLSAFVKGRVRGFHTHMKTRFILQILYRNASLYLQYLRNIDKKSEEIERNLKKFTKNKELLELRELEKSLVYFTTSLRANELVMERLMRNEKIKKYPEDTDLLEDVIVENKQAIEMANIYSGILSGTMNTFSSVISNNLNISMKLLASITIIMSIPTMIASFYGMNLNVDGMPFAHSPYGFWIVIGIAALLSGIVAIIFKRKNMF